ncbi:hypothetical protein [Bacillus sp. V5-8f]|uniref:hypothetical protein n=1 Tax=Bacillus sp. V5-8f TaxID=2053044 RepID=UPI000C784CCE|nr:hypothetical protein [Bacillus sp. V5-8f]PLT33630.1 hypothetical protein CUU64_10895 [Bacillus sp. V5-8f]
MRYGSFIVQIEHQDERNQFSTVSEEAVDFLPNPLREFYMEANPEDVEIILENLTSIRLYPLHQLRDLQKEYKIIQGFIFATLEGDPIVINDGKVFIAVHGSGAWTFEKESFVESFDMFLEYIIKNLKEKD